MMIEKLLILILSIYLVLCAGSCYMYPIYLHKIIDRFNFNIREINFFGTCINMGMWVGLPMGFIYDRYGPKISCIVSIGLVCGSYTLLHYIMNYITEISIYPLLIIAFTLGQGCCLLYSITVATNFKNFKFKDNSGIVGLLTSNIAIAPSIFTTFRENLKMLTMENFFYILSIFIGVIITICASVFRNLPAEEAYSTGSSPSERLMRAYEKFKERKVVRLLIYFNFLTLFVYIAGVVYNYYMQKYIFPLILIYPAMVLINFFTFFFEKFGIFDRLYKDEFRKKVEMSLSEDANVTGNVNLELKFMNRINTVSVNAGFNTESANNSIRREKAESVEISFWDAVKSKHFIIIFFMLMFAIGSVISNLNNVHYVLQAIHKYEKMTEEGINKRFRLEIDESSLIIYRKREMFIYVIIYFVFNSTTRLFSALILDYLIKKGSNNIYFHILFFSFIGFFSQFLGVCVAVNKVFLFVSIALAGCTHGGYMTFVPVFARTEYGLKDMGKTLGFLTSSASIGAFFISDFIFILPYDYFGEQCQGPICFYPSYMFTSVLFLINILLAYVGLIAKKKVIPKSNNSDSMIDNK